MNKLILLFCLLTINLLVSQEKNIFIEYEITNLSVGKPIYVKAKLFIKNKTSLYTINPKDTRYKKSEKPIFNKKENSIKKVIYKSNKSDFFLLVNKNKDSIEQTLGSDGYRFIVKEKIYPFKWTILKETKIIGKFICNKATTYFRGRNYIAWYSTQIPVNNGPWKFSGLPGLILEIQDSNALFSWKTKTIKYPFKEKIDITIPNKNKFKKINLKEYVSNKSRRNQKFSGQLKSKMPKDSKFRTMSIKRKGIELIYEWEKETK